MKKTLLFSLTLLLVPFIVFGSGNGEGSKEEGDVINETVTIKMMVWDIENETYTQTIATEFMAAHPNIKIEILSNPIGGHTEKLTTLLIAGKGPDVFNVQSSVEYQKFAETRQLLALDNLMQKSNTDISGYSVDLDRLRLNGGLYGLPFRMTTFALFYNMDIFDEAGIDYPGNDLTWGEYTELARQLTRGTGPDKIWGAVTNTWDFDWTGYQRGETIMGNIDSFSEGMELKWKRINEGIEPSVAYLQSTGSKNLNSFPTGNYAMFPTGDFAIGIYDNLKKDGGIPFKYNVVALPHPADVDPFTSVGQAVFSLINKDTEHPEEAFLWLTAYTGAMGSKHIAKFGTVPGWTTNETVSIMSEMFPNINLEPFFKGPFAMNHDMSPGTPEVTAAWNEEKSLMYNLEQTVEEGLANFEKRRQEILSNL